MNNVVEQNHRDIKSRCKHMKGFKNIFSALIFCTTFEEIKQFFKTKIKTRSEKRKIIAPKFQEFSKLFAMAA